MKREKDYLAKLLINLSNDADNRNVPSKSEEMIEDDFQTMRDQATSQLKLDMILHVNKYCSFLEYSTTSKCLLDKQLSFDGSVPNILYLTNQLLVVSSAMNQPVGEIAPQSFINIPVRYDFSENCEQVLNVS